MCYRLTDAMHSKLHHLSRRRAQVQSTPYVWPELPELQPINIEVAQFDPELLDEVKEVLERAGLEVQS